MANDCWSLIEAADQPLMRPLMATDSGLPLMATDSGLPMIATDCH